MLQRIIERLQEAYTKITHTPCETSLPPHCTHSSIGCKTWRGTKGHTQAIYNDSPEGCSARRKAGADLACPSNYCSQASRFTSIDYINCAQG
jgi:hypothetical protein